MRLQSVSKWNIIYDTNLCNTNLHIYKITIISTKATPPKDGVHLHVHQLQCIMRKQTKPFSENSFQFYSYKEMRKAEFCGETIKFTFLGTIKLPSFSRHPPPPPSSKCLSPIGRGGGTRLVLREVCVLGTSILLSIKLPLGFNDWNQTSRHCTFRDIYTFLFEAFLTAKAKIILQKPQIPWAVTAAEEVDSTQKLLISYT